MALFVQSARYDSGAFENERTSTFNGIESILFDGQFEFSTSDDSATYQGYGAFLDAEAGPVLISAIDCSEGQTQGDELQIMVKDVASSITDLGVPKAEQTLAAYRVAWSILLQMQNNLINYCATIFDEVKTAKMAKTGRLTGFREKLSTDFSTLAPPFIHVVSADIAFYFQTRFLSHVKCI